MLAPGEGSHPLAESSIGSLEGHRLFGSRATPPFGSETIHYLSRAPSGARPCAISALGHGLAHVGLPGPHPDAVVHDPVHDRVGVHPAAEPGVPVLLAVLGAEDRGRAAVAQPHQLEQERDHPVVRPVQQPLAQDQERVLGERAHQLRHALGPLPRGVDALIQVGHPEVERAQPPGAGLPGERAGEPRLARAGGPAYHDVAAPLDNGAGGELGRERPVEASPLRVAERAQVVPRVAQVRPGLEPFDLRGHVGLVGLAHRNAHALVEGHAREHRALLVAEGLGQARDAHRRQLGGRRLVDHSAPPL